MRSVCVKEKTWPTCSEPLTVGGGVSMEKTSARGRLRSNRYTPEASQRAIHFASSPSSAGFSGNGIRRSYTETGELANGQRLFERRAYLLYLLAHEAFGDPGYEVGRGVADDLVRHSLEHASRHIVHDRIGDHRRRRRHGTGPRGRLRRRPGVLLRGE